jgi:serine/threonine-protein kinase RsbW
MGSSVEVEIRLPADLGQLFVIRSVMATIGLRENFDEDAVDDLKLVVDEMCSSLVGRCPSAGSLTCRLEVGERSITLLATAPSDTDRSVDRNSLGWRVLCALTDSAFTWTTPDDGANYHVHIRANRARDTLLAG